MDIKKTLKFILQDKDAKKEQQLTSVVADVTNHECDVREGDATYADIIQSSDAFDPGDDVIAEDDAPTSGRPRITSVANAVNAVMLEKMKKVPRKGETRAAGETEERVRPVLTDLLEAQPDPGDVGGTTPEAEANQRPSLSRRLSRGSQDEYLKASRVGDFRRLTNLLMKDDSFNVNSVRDVMGHSPMRLAVKNDHLDVVEQLLNRSTPASVYESLLLAISLDHDHITEAILRHPKYQQIKEHIHIGALGKFVESPDEESPDDTMFSADVTPLVLAAQRNQFEVVKLLLSLDEVIDEPHQFHCDCDRCRGAPTFDELRFAKTRLNVFRALASDSYLAIFHRDPLLAAFELARKMKRLSIQEKYFKNHYQKLADQLSRFCVRLMDKVRDGIELDHILNETTGAALSSYEKLARIKLAIHYREKTFVAHPACQKKLTTLWQGNLHFLEHTSSWLLFPWLLVLMLFYPFMAVCYWIYPWGRVGRLLRTPAIKFWSSACSYIAFVVMVIAYSATEQPSAGYLLSEHATVGPLYRKYANTSGTPLADDYVRHHRIGYGTIVLSIWLVGLIWQGCKRLYTERLTYFVENWYNGMDVIMYICYISSFTLRYFSVLRVQAALDFFSDETTWYRIELGDITTNKEAGFYGYWLTADRVHWEVFDPYLVGEALFAVANLLCVIRLTYLLTMNERIGPLLISLAKMIQDVVAFMFIFVLIVAAFVVCFHNLYWYYYPANRGRAERNPPQSTDSETAGDYFGRVDKTIKTIYWSIFGMVEMNEGTFTAIEHLNFSSIVGHVMFACYNWIIVIIMINMLIAMMTRSYDIISNFEDVEWKFSRTKLYMEYIKEGSTLCVPFNLVPSWKGVYVMFRCMCDCCCSRNKAKKTVRVVKENGVINTDNPAFSTLSESSIVNDEIPSGHPKPKIVEIGEFELVMSRVVKRFVAQHKNHGGDDSEDGHMKTLRRDVSTFRYEVSNSLRRQDDELTSLQERMRKLDTRLGHVGTSLSAQAQSIMQGQDVSFADVRAELEVVRETLGQCEAAERDNVIQVEQRIWRLSEIMEVIRADNKSQFYDLLETIDGMTTASGSVTGSVTTSTPGYTSRVQVAGGGAGGGAGGRERDPAALYASLPRSLPPTARALPYHRLLRQYDLLPSYTTQPAGVEALGEEPGEEVSMPPPTPPGRGILPPTPTSTAPVNHLRPRPRTANPTNNAGSAFRPISSPAHKVVLN